MAIERLLVSNHSNRMHVRQMLAYKECATGFNQKYYN